MNDKHSTDASDAPHAASLDDLRDALVLDVRRAATYADAEDVIPGSIWRDPAHVDEWAHGVPTDRDVIVYCVHGHEVSQGTAMRLREAGRSARFLEGGIAAWKASGRPTDAKQRAA